MPSSTSSSSKTVCWRAGRTDDVFAESVRRREGAEEWVFYEGPPTANGRPGIHHVWARLFKDIYPRFHTMRGKYVPARRAGTATACRSRSRSRRSSGFAGKPEIEEFGIEAFNQRCRESVQRYVEDWSALTGRIGMWLDMSDAYWTMNNSYIESVWWLFRQMWDAEQLYEGYKVVPYCGRCGTALSSHELGQPGAYRDVTEDSVYVRFPVEGRDFDLLVWTTTPWTLVSNVGAAIGPDIEYVRVRAPRPADSDLVMARAAGRRGAGRRRGDPRAGRRGRSRRPRYERPFDSLPTAEGDGWRIVAADFVTTEDGSGIVHLAPAFGEIDREVAAAEDLPILNPVNGAARFTDAVPAASPASSSRTRTRSHRGAARVRPPRHPRAVRALLPALLALWHAADLLGQAHLVRPHRPRQGTRCSREREDQLAPRAHQARALRRLAREQRRLGAVPRPLLGHADPRVALPRLRPRHVRRLGRGALELAGESSPISTCTARTSTTS